MEREDRYFDNCHQEMMRNQRNEDRYREGNRRYEDKDGRRGRYHEDMRDDDDDDDSRERRRRRRRREQREDDRDRRDDRRHPVEKPCRVIVLRQLPLDVDEDEIRIVLQIFGAPIKDVRLVRHKETGVSRGFAFVEFQFLPDAQRWMDSNQGQLDVGGYKVSMNYSTSRDRDDDWFCSQCGTHNFKRRGYCFKCSIPKDESERFSEISRVPTRTLLLMGLDLISVEDTIRKELLEITAVDMNIQLVCDPATNASRGACYVVVATYEYSAQLLEILNNMNPPFSVDGKAVTVHYCRDNTDPMYANQQQWSAEQHEAAAAHDFSAYYQQQQQQYDGQHYPGGGDGNFDGQQLNEYNQYRQQYSPNGDGRGPADNMALAQEQVQAARRLQQFADNDRGNRRPRNRDRRRYPSDGMDRGEESSSRGMRQQQQQQQQRRREKQEPAVIPAPPETMNKERVTEKAGVVPDTSQYQYDETSGYYYDPQTGLYYDATSQYYYNADTQKYLYWDASQQTYTPVAEVTAVAANTATSTTTAATTTPTTAVSAPSIEPNKEKEKEKKKKEEDKSRLAKKVAKDMARWAKSMNDSRLNQKKSQPLASAEDVLAASEAAAADAGFAMLSKRKPIIQSQSEADPEETKVSVWQAMKTVEKEAIVASYGSGSESDEDNPAPALEASSREVSNPAPVQLTDWNKLVCLLCKRQFPSKEVLVKHQQFSDLHKQNLDALSQKLGRNVGMDDSANEMKYRDRAKERRAKFGPSEAPPPKRRYQPPPVPVEEPTKFGIGTDNIGNRMLQNMGWKSGSGLGKKMQGRTNIIEVERRAEGAGLGMRGSRKRGTSDSYRVAVKQAAQQRFKEMQQAEDDDI